MSILKKMKHIRRFWTPRPDSERLDDDGFMLPPQPTAPYTHNLSSVQLAELSHFPVIVLLGEPGMGKSAELHVAHDQLTEANGPNRSLYFDLRDYDNVSDLRASLFEDISFKSWQDGQHTLTLWFDSLDEAVVASKALGERLATVLGDLVSSSNLRSRLRVRIACRTAAWPETVEAKLKAIWHADEVCIAVLAPFSRDDVKSILRDAQVSSADQAFLKIVGAGAGPLAARPISLEFILRSLKAGGMPRTQIELYEQGCLRLADEMNPFRARRGVDRKLTGQQRLAVAARMAAFSIFGGRTGFRMGPLEADDTAFNSELDLSTDNLVGGFEYSNATTSREVASMKFEVNLSAVGETLHTALFASKVVGTASVRLVTKSAVIQEVDASRITWAHKSFAEYLAARWIFTHRISADIVDSIFFARVGSSKKVVPQLEQTAAWLAGLDKEFLRRVLRNDPVLLLQSDLTDADSADRAAVVNALLELSREDDLSYSVYNLDHEFASLRHPALGNVLTPIIGDNQNTLQERILATRIANACQLEEAVSVAIQLVLDGQLSPRLRREAMLLVNAHGNSDSKLRVAAVVLGRDGSDASEMFAKDTDDEVRGAILDALWPDTISTRDLFQVLSVPKQETFFGTYRWFINHLTRHVVEQGLSVDELRLGIKWSSEYFANIGRRAEHDVDSGLGRLHEALIDSCWSYLVSKSEASWDTEILSALHGAVVAKLGYFISLDHKESRNFGQFLENVETRPAYIAHLLAWIEANATALSESHPRENLGAVLLHSRLLQTQDIDLLTGALERSTVPSDSIFVTTLVDALVTLALWYPSEAFEKVYEVAFHHPTITPGLLALGENLAKHTQAIELDSNAAAEARKMDRYRIEHELQRDAIELRNKEQLDMVRKHITNHLSLVLEGDRKSWWHLLYWLGVSKDGTSLTEHYSSIREQPLFESIPDESAGKLSHFAAKYLTEGDDRHEDWKGERIDRPAMAGVRAMRFLLDSDIKLFDSLPDKVFKNWTGAVMSFPLLNEEPKAEWYRRTVLRVGSVAPGLAADVLVGTFLREDATHGYSSALDKAESLWMELASADSLSRRLLDAAKRSGDPSDTGLTANALTALLTSLTEHDLNGSRAYVRSLVNQAAVDTVTAPSDEDLEDLVLRPSQPHAAISHRLDARALAAAIALINHTPDASWPTVWPFIAMNDAFARQVIGQAVYSTDRENHPFLSALDEASIGALYIRVEELFDSTAENFPDSGWVTRRMQVARWRDNLLQTLVNRASLHGIDALEAIRTRFPDSVKLSHYLRAAYQEFRRVNWVPMSVSQLRALSDPNTYSIDSEQTLVHAILNEIDAFSREIRGTNASLEQLWDEISPEVFRPKDEEKLTVLLSRHLERELARKGCVLSRETRIRPGIGNRPAEDVDIRVSAISQDRLGKSLTTSVVIEVKGQWFRNLRKSVQAQLVDRYLRENSDTSSGIFVVGWYLSKEWDEEDHRKGDARRNGSDIEQFRIELDAIASQLTTRHRYVRAVVIDLSLTK